MPDHLPRLRPPDPPMVPVALAGMVAWVVAGLVLLAAGGPRDWLWTCLAGFLLGLPGLAIMIRRDRRRRYGRPGQP